MAWQGHGWLCLNGIELVKARSGRCFMDESRAPDFLLTPLPPEPRSHFDSRPRLITPVDANERDGAWCAGIRLLLENDLKLNADFRICIADREAK